MDTETVLLPNKRYITGHDPVSGKSIYLDAPELQHFPVHGFGAAARSYATATLPPEIDNDEDLKAYISGDSVASHTKQEIIVPPTNSDKQRSQAKIGGMNVVSLDIKPSAVGHMHRTVSLDISTCISGEVFHELDSGQKVRLMPGVSCPVLRQPFKCRSLAQCRVPSL